MGGLLLVYLMNIPNSLSLIRLLCAPLFCWLLISNHFNFALVLFLVASLTDAADGYIAKRWKQETELGRYLDPLADKVLLMIGFITLSWIQLLPVWLTLIIVSRDIVLIGGVILSKMVAKVYVVQPLIISKVNTFLQMLLIMLVLLNSQFTELNSVVTMHIWLTAISTVASLWAYISRWSIANGVNLP
ncbi:MAG: CDP-alcohol phosphatidyltransferase family protein [Magnetococcales bacterium]|nr:CDP-alcohol phosphatidyltransferase family protein [Magnetococcales bacterium]